MGIKCNHLFRSSLFFLATPPDVDAFFSPFFLLKINLIKKIKEHFNKQQHQVVTVDEFCQYMGLQNEVLPGN